jgi:hypothetical protein
MPQGSVPPPNPPEWLNLSPAPTPATGVWEGTPTSADAPATGDWTPGRATAPQGEAAPPRPALPGYEILGELGRGGMGVV